MFILVAPFPFSTQNVGIIVVCSITVDAVSHRAGDVEHEDDVSGSYVVSVLTVFVANASSSRLVFPVSASVTTDLLTWIAPSVETAPTAVCAAGGSASAAIAEIGIMPTSISTASTMLKKRFFMFFFPPVSNFLMCFDAFLSAKVGCVSLYQNFSKMQAPKHPSKRPEILVLSSFPLKNSRF